MICFDVADPAKPALASNVNLSVEDEDENEEDKKRRRYANRWNFSEAILNDNNLYLSSQHSEYIRIEEEEEKPKDDDEEEEEDPDEPIEKPKPRPESIPKPRGYWVTRYELHVVDYTDPADPVVRDTVAIPGSLIGTSHGGALLYTNGSHWDEERKWDGNWFDASSYDGLEAHLVDSIEQPNSWPQSHVRKATGHFSSRSPSAPRCLRRTAVFCVTTHSPICNRSPLTRMVSSHCSTKSSRRKTSSN